MIEGEKHFYRRQEVIDLVNVVRVLDHPHDQIALTGLLRSPLGGLTDREVFECYEAGLSDYLSEPQGEHPRAEPVRRLYGQLARLHREVPALPLADAIQLIFDRLPMLEIAAASLHSEQAVANLLKVKQTAAALSDRPHLTLSGFAELMVERIDEQPEEAESPLAEASSDAVQILTIHKAKGLEFPVVLLPGLHQGSGRERDRPHVVHDWSSGTYGLSLGEQRTLGAVLAREKFALREEAERRRVLYVGMTRAKDLLVLSGGKVERSVGESTLDWLQEIGQGTVGEVNTESLQIGTSVIPHQVVPAPNRTWQRRVPAGHDSVSAIDPSTIVQLWDGRKERWIAACATERQFTPTTMARQGMVRPSKGNRLGSDPEISRLVGIAAHRILQEHDFAGDAGQLLEHIDPISRGVIQKGQQAWLPDLQKSLRGLFTTFVRSDLYDRLRSAEILGREVPFIMPWGARQVMEGVIDLVYRFDGALWIADYKTDAVSADQAVARAEQYRPQGEVYKAAVRHSLKIESVRFHCLFLECSTAVEL